MPPDVVPVLEEFSRKMPVYWLIQQLADRWTLPVMAALCEHPRRFLELQRNLQPVSKRMLTLTLRNLTEAGFVSRTEGKGTPPQVSYQLTSLGHSLCEPLQELNSWAQCNRLPPTKNHRPQAADHAWNAATICE